MSRYAHFYKLNSREGKEHLYDDLISTAKFETSFSTYILDRAAKCGKSFTITYSQVINSILNDFNEMRPSELWEIVGWYEQHVYGNDYRTNADREKNEQILGSMLKSSGIESLFDITSSTVSSYAFTSQYSKYRSQYPVDESDEGYGEGSNIKSDGFLRFLDYMVLLMCKINEAGCDGTFSYSDNYSASQLHELERVWLAYKDDTALYEFVNKEAEWIEQCWIKNEGGDDIDWPEEIAVQTVWDTYYFLRKCLDMKAVINEENTNIVMIYG